MAEKRNICIVVPIKNAISETFIKAHIDKLQANIFVLYGYYPDYKYMDKPLTQIYTQERIFAKILKLLPYFIYWRIKRFLDKKRKKTFNPFIHFLKINRIDAVLAEYGTTGATIFHDLKKQNIPLVIHFHGFDAYRYDVIEKNKEAYAEMFQYAFRTIAVSNNMVEQLKRLGLPPKRCVFNPYGPNERFAEIKPDRDSQQFVSLGRFTEKKAPYLTILAFSEVVQTYPEAKLCMIGDGHLLDACKQLVYSLKLSGHIEFTGALSSNAIMKKFAECFCFVQHSVRAADGDSEGTPVAILEAGASGLPVIATRHAGIQDVVVENETGLLVDEHQYLDQAKHMKTLYIDRAWAEKLGEASRKHILQHYSMNKHISTLQNIIDDAKN